MYDFKKSIIIIITYFSVFLAFSLFIFAIILNIEPLALFCGVYIIGFLLYRKINKLYSEVKLYKNLPLKIKDINKLKLDDVKKGYQ
jgi:hypothetical protein